MNAVSTQARWIFRTLRIFVAKRKKFRFQWSKETNNKVTTYATKDTLHAFDLMVFRADVWAFVTRIEALQARRTEAGEDGLLTEWYAHWAGLAR